MTKMTKSEVAKELLDPYFIDPGLCSFEGDTCLYDGPNGCKCVFAMACVDGVWLEEDTSCADHLENLGFEILQAKYRHVNDIEFWSELQEVHDHLANGGKDRYLRAAKLYYKSLVGQEPPKENKDV